MKHALPARPALASRPTSTQLPEFEILDSAHRAALQMLQSFKGLVSRLQDTGLDDEARQIARRIEAFFNGPGRDHHADEEKHVFPGLLASSDEVLVSHVRRLQQDHGWIEEDWRELAPHVRAVVEGYNGYDLPLLVAALPVFEALYLDHIALEETLVYPAAKRQKLAVPNGRNGEPALLQEPKN
ncbi:MAG: hemerythrin domain-containing protein [Rubrivivax sp.]|nr:hemerythrin domain-containing protein [Rubrivivax sp.]